MALSTRACAAAYREGKLQIEHLRVDRLDTRAVFHPRLRLSRRESGLFLQSCSPSTLSARIITHQFGRLIVLGVYSSTWNVCTGDGSRQCWTGNLEPQRLGLRSGLFSRACGVSSPGLSPPHSRSAGDQWRSNDSSLYLESVLGSGVHFISPFPHLGRKETDSSIYLLYPGASPNLIHFTKPSRLLHTSCPESSALPVLILRSYHYVVLHLKTSQVRAFLMTLATFKVSQIIPIEELLNVGNRRRYPSPIGASTSRSRSSGIERGSC